MDCVLGLLEYCQFLFGCEDFTVLIVQSAESVLELHHSNKFFNVICADSKKNAFKERGVVKQGFSQLQGLLEIGPQEMVFVPMCLRSDFNFALQPIIELICILPVLSKSVDFHVAFFGAAILRDKESVFFL